MLMTSRKGHRCAVCGADHTTCGGGPSTSQSIDQRIEDAAMSSTLQRYEVTAPNGTKTIMKLNDADRKKYPGAVAIDGPSGPLSDEERDEAQVKARTATRNKARTTASTKGAGRRAKRDAPAADAATEPASE